MSHIFVWGGWGGGAGFIVGRVSPFVSFDLGICIFLYFLVFLHNGHISVYIFASICVCIIYLGGQPLEWGDHSGDRVLICISFIFVFILGTFVLIFEYVSYIWAGSHLSGGIIVGIVCAMEEGQTLASTHNQQCPPYHRH